MTESHSSSVMLTSTRSRRMPALLTSTCRSPKASMAELIRRWPPSQSATLSALAMASPPMALISSTTCWAGVRSSPEPSMAPPRSLTTTLAPSWAKRSACSRPMPRPAPVMMATLPSSAPMRRRLSAPLRGGQPPQSGLGVEVHRRAPGDGGPLRGVDVEHLGVRGAEHVGHLQAVGGQDGGGLVDRLADDGGRHRHQVGALRDLHRHG